MSPKRKRRHQEPSRLDPDSLAGKYRAFRASQRSANLAQFETKFDFPLDPFQLEAAAVLDRGQDVLVTAPTSAGKTIVGLYGMFLALQRGQRLFYTTPIKALSNQKFNEFSQMFGEDNIGLLTGDTSVNGDAPIVVMTTEVLRNMIYAGSDLSELGFVVMDEVHYLSDHFRGPVWEEIIIHLSQSVQLISLSATVSNAADFAAWLSSVRGETQVVSTTERPVPLEHFMIDPAGEIMPLFEHGKRSGHVSRALLARAAQITMPRRGRFRRRRVDRCRVVAALKKTDRLPAIVFVFSRQGCNDAAAQVLAGGIRLTDADEAEAIRSEVEMSLAPMNPADLSAIDVLAWEETLAAGIAAHHAGILPIQKQIVESLFAKGLIKLVFATETLALGINMPARTVVLESLSKWNGQERANLTAGEYTQLTGRAGRRGIDTLGCAITVLETRNPPHLLATLAGAPTYPLHSSFAPNYNMAVNLLARTSLEGAKETVEKSFAQYEAMGSSKGLFRKLHHYEQLAEAAAAEVSCEQGDVFELLNLMQNLSQKEKQARARRYSPHNTPQARAADQREIQQARALVKSHPVYRCPDRDKHLQLARKAATNRELAAQKRQQIETRTKSLARQLESICQVLVKLGYVSEDYALLTPGRMLQVIYSERDLLVVECWRRGLFDELSVADLAGALSVCICETRGGATSNLIPADASRNLAGCLDQMARLNFEIASLQEAHQLDAYPPLETGVVTSVVAWTAGANLNECLELYGLAAGDFVRMLRQLIDIAQQLRNISGNDALSDKLRRVISQVKRGVVAWDF